MRGVLARIVLLILGIATLFWWLNSNSAAELRLIIAGWWVHGVMGL